MAKNGIKIRFIAPSKTRVIKQGKTQILPKAIIDDESTHEHDIIL